MTTAGGRKHGGFTLIELMIVVGIISLLAVLAMPTFSRSRTNAFTTTCLQSQRLVFAGASRHELDANTSLYSIRNNNNAIRQTLLTNQYIKLSAHFNCPSDSNKNSADYRLLYANSTTLTNTRCMIVSSTHVLR